jgi:hypothetical protein
LRAGISTFVDLSRYVGASVTASDRQGGQPARDHLLDTLGGLARRVAGTSTGPSPATCASKRGAP